MQFKEGHKFTFSQKKAYVRFRRIVLANPLIMVGDSGELVEVGTRSNHQATSPYTVTGKQ